MNAYTPLQWLPSANPHATLARVPGTAEAVFIVYDFIHSEGDGERNYYRAGATLDVFLTDAGRYDAEPYMSVEHASVEAAKEDAARLGYHVQQQCAERGLADAGARTVGEALANDIGIDWSAYLAGEVLVLPIDCVVGELCLHLCSNVMAALDCRGVGDIPAEVTDGRVGTHECRHAMLEAAAMQCNVWLFG